jgi:hypothetical protein
MTAKTERPVISTGAGVAIFGIWLSTTLLTALGAALLFMMDIEEKLKQMGITMPDFSLGICIAICVVWFSAWVFTRHLLGLD